MAERTGRGQTTGGAPLSVTAWLGADTGPEAASGEDRYRELLREVIDPELGVNIVDLGLVYDIRLSEGTVLVRMTMTTPGCPLSAYFDDAVHACLYGAPGVHDIDLRIVWDPPWRPEMMSDLAKAQLGWRQ